MSKIQSPKSANQSISAENQSGVECGRLDFGLFYETRGAANKAPLVLIPGFASGAWIWFRQVEELSKQFRVITFDPRGVARSQVSDGKEISFETIAEDVAALLDELKIEKANVLGASFGGFAAQEFALKFPERLDKLVLACTSFGGRNHVAPAWEVLAAFVSTNDLNKSERIRKFLIPAFSPAFAAAHEEIVEQVCQMREQNSVPEKSYLAQLHAAMNFDSEAHLKEIKAETLVLTGDSDAVVPPQNSQNLAGALPNVRLETVTGGSHLFFIEKAEEFNRIVTNFLQS